MGNPLRWGIKGGGSGPCPQILSLPTASDHRGFKKLLVFPHCEAGRQLGEKKWLEMSHITVEHTQAPKPEDAGEDGSLAAFQTPPYGYKKLCWRESWLY